MPKCKIIVKDEINCKIINLQPGEYRQLVKMFEYEVPGARYLPSVRLGRWNGKVSYFALSGSTYINLLPEIIPKLTDWNYDVELEDIREYSHDIQLETITESSFSHKLWPKNHPLENQPIMLRDYQVSAINQFLSTPQSIQQLPTGSGKTIVTAALSNSVEKYGRSIVIVPNKSLVVQTEEDYVNLGLDVGVYFGDRKDIGKTHTICTWQSLHSLLKSTKNEVGDLTMEEFIKDVVCVICDEVHQCKAEVLKTLLTSVMSHVPIRWGLTGTIPKSKFESMALFNSIGPLVNTLKASDLQDIGVLSKCHVNIIQLQDNAEFREYQSELKYLLEHGPRLDKISQLVNSIKTSGNTLVLVDRVAAGKELLTRIPDSVFVSGETKLSERKEEYDEVSDSSEKVIIATYGVAAVGINIPRIFNLVLIEPGKSFVRVIQSIGRGLRVAKDKDHVEIYDVTSSCKFSKRHLTQRKGYYNESNYPHTTEKLKY